MEASSDLIEIIHKAISHYKKWPIGSSNYNIEIRSYLDHWSLIRDELRNQTVNWRASNSKIIQELYQESNSARIRIDEHFKVNTIDPENEELVLALREALIDYETYEIPTTNVGEALETLKNHWNELKMRIENQSVEYQARNIDLTNEVSTACHLLKLAFENVLLEEEQNGSTIKEEQTEPPIQKPVQPKIVTPPNSVTVCVPKALSQTIDEPSKDAINYDLKRYDMASLTQVKYVLHELENLPKIPEQPNDGHFSKLREAISVAVKHIEEAKCTHAQFAPIILALVPNAFNPTTRMMWEFEASRNPVTLTILRNFLAHQQEIRISGWCPEDDMRGAASTSTRARVDQSPKRFKNARAQSVSLQQAQLQLKPKKCYVCDGPHHMFRCTHFLAKTLPARWQYVSAESICPNCLRGLHSAMYCEVGGCKKCKGQKHNSVLCEQNPQM